MRDIDRAVELLKPLFSGLVEDRNETTDIYADVYDKATIERVLRNVIDN